MGDPVSDDLILGSVLDAAAAAPVVDAVITPVAAGSAVSDAAWAASMAGAPAIADAVASSVPSWASSAMPEIGGTLDSLTGAGFSSALPQASMMPEAMTTIPGAVAPEGIASLPSTIDPSMTVPGSPWEDLTAPFKQANSMMDKALASPEAQAVSKASKLYNAGKMLDSMINPPEIPQRVSGLTQRDVQPIQPPQRRGGLGQAFGNRNFNQYT